MNTHLTILTGHSRGLGLAMAQQLLEAGHTVLGISRQRATGLDQEAPAASGELIEWQADLADGAPVPNHGSFADSVLPVMDAGQAELVNEDFEFEEGVALQHAPGHTPGHC
jgi:NAD(P)-dependent dehydrogenase (short-subunit alcohol dehydrogenase family)